jgi:hypothetical protein
MIFRLISVGSRRAKGDLNEIEDVGSGTISVSLLQKRDLSTLSATNRPNPTANGCPFYLFARDASTTALKEFAKQIIVLYTSWCAQNYSN